MMTLVTGGTTVLAWSPRCMSPTLALSSVSYLLLFSREGDGTAHLEKLKIILVLCLPKAI